MKVKEKQEILNKWKILTDTREQNGYKYPNTRIQMLKSGDYSIEYDGKSYENQIVIERKGSVSEIYDATGAGRERWENELERLKLIPIKFVLCEFDYLSLVNEAPPGRLEPQCVYGSIFKWHATFNIPFIFVKNHKNGRDYLYKYFWEYLTHIILGIDKEVI